MNMRVWQVPTIKAYAGYYSFYWKVRGKTIRFRNWILGYALGTREATRNTVVSTSYIKDLAKGAVLPVLLAVALVIIIRSLDSPVKNIAINHAWSGWLGNLFTQGLDGNAYNQLLATIAGVTGVFLALYFTAVSTVASSVYAKVPSNIRELIIRDRVGNVYVQMVAFLTAFSSLLLAVQAAGTPPFRLAPPILIVLVSFAIFAFIKLGQRAFFLADPTLLAGVLRSDFIRAAKNSSANGWLWNDSELQKNYRWQGSKSLSTLGALAKVTGTQSHLQGDSYPRLIRTLVAMAGQYLTLKPRVPTNSNWFGQKYLHKQWYLVESTELDMATQTDSGLRPNEVPDESWVETEILNSVLKAIKESSAKSGYEQLHAELNTLPELLGEMGILWSADEGEKWCTKISDTIIDDLIENAPDLTEGKQVYINGVIDVLSSLPLSLEIGFARALEGLNISSLRENLREADWLLEGSPYRFNLPRNAVKTLEQIHEGVVFEKTAESKTQTPGWYITELAFNSLEWALFNQWKLTMKLVESWYGDNADKLQAANLHLEAAAVHGRALELSWKIERHVQDIKAKIEELREGVLLDLKRPEWDWQALEKQVEGFRQNTIERIANSIRHLITIESTSDLPDYFGAAVHRTGEACFEALLNNDKDMFEKLFVPYFAGILETTNRVRPQVLDWETRSAVTWFSEPIIDLVDISGYAYIFSELYNNSELWSTCSAVWDRYLGESPTDKLQLLASILSHHQRLFAIPPRATLRINRQFKLEAKMRGLPHQEPESSLEQPQVIHDSAFIIRIAPRGDMPMFVDAVDVFTVIYLMPKPGADSLDFGVNDSKVEEVNGRREHRGHEDGQRQA